MKRVRKVLFLVVALVMAMGVFAPTSRAYTTNEATATNVVLTKVLMEDLTGFPTTTGKDGTTEYDGNQITNLENFFGTGAAGIPNVDFTISTVVGGVTKYVTKTTATQDIVVDGVTVTQTYNTLGDTPVKFTTGTDGTINVTLLPGTYTFEEVSDTYLGPNGETLTGSAAVPVTITLPMVDATTGEYFDTTNPLYLYPKNTDKEPKMDKNYATDTAGANDTALNPDNNQRDKDKVTRDIGDVLDYQVETIIPKDSRYATLRWNDIMTKGLTYNKNLVITATGTADVGGTMTPGQTLTFDPATDYVKTEDDRGFELRFTDAGLTKLNNYAKNGDVTIRLEYSATINGDAKVDTADKNDIKLDYGNNKTEVKEPVEVTPVEGKINVTKTWSDTGGEPPAGTTVVYTLYRSVDGGVTYDPYESVTKTAAPWDHTFDAPPNNIDGTTIIDETSPGYIAYKYKVGERVSGYTPDYVVDNTTGTVAIANNKNTDNPNPIDPSEPSVVTHGKKFVKMQQGTDTRLPGAEFVIYKNVTVEGVTTKKYLANLTTAQQEALAAAVTAAKTTLDQKIAAYEALTAEQQAGTEGTTAKQEIDTAQAAYNAAFIASKNNYDWVDSLTIPDPVNTGEQIPNPNIVRLVSNSNGQFEITGLAAGTYYLEETKQPEGFAPLADDVEFTVGAGTYSGNATGQVPYEPTGTGTDALRVNNIKITIPVTGGIGTVLFTVAGVALMGGAVVAMKKRREDDEE